MNRLYVPWTWLGIILVTVAACGGEPEGTLSLPGPDGGRTVTRALAGDASESWTRGFIVARSGEPVLLCEALTESYPPQCAGASVVLRDGILWRQPQQDTVVIGGVEDGVLTGNDGPCGYTSDGPCARYPGVMTSGGVLWTEVEYSVIGTLRNGGLWRLEAPPGAEL